jgi:hypothetical protein
MQQTIADSVKEAFQDLGPSAAKTFAQSFGLKFGPTHPDAIAAQKEIDRLMGTKLSPSQALAIRSANATVVIPNTRLSSQPRTRGRSVD